MSRAKKNTPPAQASSSVSTEAVLKLPPRTSSLVEVSSSSKEEGPIEGDGPGENATVLNYVIEVASNGFFLMITYADIDVPDERLVFDNLDDVLQTIRDTF